MYGQHTNQVHPTGIGPLDEASVRKIMISVWDDKEKQQQKQIELKQKQHAEAFKRSLLLQQHEANENLRRNIMRDVRDIVDVHSRDRPALDWDSRTRRGDLGGQDKQRDYNSSRNVRNVNPLPGSQSRGYVSNPPSFYVPPVPVSPNLSQWQVDEEDDGSGLPVPSNPYSGMFTSFESPGKPP